MVSDFRNLFHVSRQGLSVYHRSFSSFFFGHAFRTNKKEAKSSRTAKSVGFFRWRWSFVKFYQWFETPDISWSYSSWHFVTLIIITSDGWFSKIPVASAIFFLRMIGVASIALACLGAGRLVKHIPSPVKVGRGRVHERWRVWAEGKHSLEVVELVKMIEMH